MKSLMVCMISLLILVEVDKRTMGWMENSA